jgi:hypothetical protein
MMSDNTALATFIELKHGVTPDANDPIMIEATARRFENDKFILQVRQLIDLLAETRSLMSQAEARRLAGMMIAHLTATANRLVLTSQKKLLAIAGLSIVGAFGAGIWVDRHLSADPTMITSCEPATVPSGEAWRCVVWTKLPAKN